MTTRTLCYGTVCTAENQFLEDDETPVEVCTPSLVNSAAEYGVHAQQSIISLAVAAALLLAMGRVHL